MNVKYRKCVGMMILNSKNEVLVGRRLDHPSGYWQMPQGGIDENEDPEEAVWREMMEEIGTNKAELCHVSNQWVNYEIPQETLDNLPLGKIFIGQTQKWFIFKFTGKSEDINVQTQNPEFSEWKWMNVDDLVDNAVPFKQKVYKTILDEFSDIF